MSIRIHETVAKVIVLATCPFLLWGFGSTAIGTIAQFRDVKPLLAFLIGVVAFGLIWHLVWQHMQMLCTFSHEFTHMLFGLLFLKVPHSFVATRNNGGHVMLSGGNFVITLAPYFFPTISYMLLPMFLVVPRTWQWVACLILGASVTFHIASTFQDLHWQQTDLHKAGILFTSIFLPTAIIIFFGAILVIPLAGSDSFISYWKGGLRASVYAPLQLIGVIRE